MDLWASLSNSGVYLAVLAGGYLLKRAGLFRVQDARDVYKRQVVKIINGHHTGRTTGAPITDLALSMLSRLENENRPG